MEEVREESSKGPILTLVARLKEAVGIIPELEALARRHELGPEVEVEANPGADVEDSSNGQRGYGFGSAMAEEESNFPPYGSHQL